MRKIAYFLYGHINLHISKQWRSHRGEAPPPSFGKKFYPRISFKTPWRFVLKRKWKIVKVDEKNFVPAKSKKCVL